MIPAIVAGLMWALVVSLLILRRGRGERSITYAALTIAIAMTLNIDPIYRALDGLLGGTNLATLPADLALMVGIFFLGRGVAKATEYRPRIARFALGRVILAVALTGTIAAFFLIDRGETTTTFMLDNGAQPAAATYSIIQFVYDGIVVTAMAAVAARRVRDAGGVDRLPALSLLLGSILGLLLSLVVIAMDILHVVGALAPMFVLGDVYAVLFPLTFLFLCLGLAGQPAIRLLRSRARGRATRELLAETTPVWQRASAVHPGPSQHVDTAGPATDPETRLHRYVVEIRDAVVDPRVEFQLTEEHREVVERAEHHLLGAFAAERSRANPDPAPARPTR